MQAALHQTNKNSHSVVCSILQTQTNQFLIQVTAHQWLACHHHQQGE